MISSRFNRTDCWTDGQGRRCVIKDAPTTHLLNVLNWLYKSPEILRTKTIEDIEARYPVDEVAAGNWYDDIQVTDPQNARFVEINKVTSVTSSEIIQKVLQTPVFKSIRAELESRGVNLVVMEGGFKTEVHEISCPEDRDDGEDYEDEDAFITSYVPSPLKKAQKRKNNW